MKEKNSANDSAKIEIANHIFKEYGATYEKHHLQALAYFISCITTLGLEYEKTHGEDFLSYFRGAIDGMRYLACRVWNSPDPEDVVRLAECWDELTNRPIQKIGELNDKIARDKYIFEELKCEVK